MGAIVSVLVPEPIVSDVTKILTRLGKRAGVEWRTLDGHTTIIVDEHIVTAHDYNGVACRWRTVQRVVTCARIECGELPRQDGWTFVARLEHTECGVVVSCPLGERLDPAWREAEPVCDHCHTKRRRNDTFVLRFDGLPESRGCPGDWTSNNGCCGRCAVHRNEHWALKQIGRNCLADFLQADPASLVARAEWCATLAPFFSCGDPDERDPWGSWARFGETSTLEFLAQAVACVRIDGFAKSNTERSTVSETWTYMGSPPRDKGMFEDWKAHQPTETDAQTANEIMLWAATDDDFARSDYGHNLRVSLACRGVNRQRSGIVASAPSAYQRMLSKASPRGASAGHWGEVGKRSTVLATLKRVHYTDGMYGRVAICGFETAEGHDLVWFASGDAPSESDIGTAYSVKATVKRHDERKGRPQTVISRAKLTVVGMTAPKQQTLPL